MKETPTGKTEVLEIDVSYRPDSFDMNRGATNLVLQQLRKVTERLAYLFSRGYVIRLDPSGQLPQFKLEVAEIYDPGGLDASLEEIEIHKRTRERLTNPQDPRFTPVITIRQLLYESEASLTQRRVSARSIEQIKLWLGSRRLALSPSPDAPTPILHKERPKWAKTVGLDDEINELDLPPYLINRLHDAGISKIRTLVNHTERGILELESVGTKKLSLIIAALDEHLLCLKTEK